MSCRFPDQDRISPFRPMAELNRSGRETASISNPFRVVSVSKLFEFSSTVYGFEPNLASYDVAPDGRFLAARRDAVAADEIQVVLNWTDELRGLLKR